MSENTVDIHDYSKIKTEGSFISLDENGAMCLNLDKRVSPVAMGEIYKYLYQDRVYWTPDTPDDLVKEVKIAAEYLQLDRLVLICESHLEKEKTVMVTDSTWWENMKWAFENLRQDDQFDCADIKIKCNDDKIVRVHSLIICCTCDYFMKLFGQQGQEEIETEERKTKTVTFELVDSVQIEAVLRYLYTKEFKVEVKDIVPVWLMSDKLQIPALQEECESTIINNLTKDTVSDIQKIAEGLNSKKVIEACKNFK